MNTVGEKERHSQKRGVPFFQKTLAYTYRRNGRNSTHQNCNLLPERLADWLKNSRYDSSIVTKVLRKAEQALFPV